MLIFKLQGMRLRDNPSSPLLKHKCSLWKAHSKSQESARVQRLSIRESKELETHYSREPFYFIGSKDKEFIALTISSVLELLCPFVPWPNIRCFHTENNNKLHENTRTIHKETRGTIKSGNKFNSIFNKLVSGAHYYINQL